MRYFFVIQGEGRGHLTQAISLKQMLEKNGHEVVGVMVGVSKKRKLPEYFKNKIELDIMQFQSPNFMPAPKDKKPFLPASIIYNLLLIPVYIESILKIRNTINALQPDVVVNFYELLCGLTYGIFNPQALMVNIAHQYYFLTPNFEYKGNKPIQFKLLNFYSRFTTLNSTKILAMSFRNETLDLEQNISIVPPLLRREVLSMKQQTGEYIHGYILNNAYVTELINWSKNNVNVPLHFFWDKKNAPSVTNISDSLTLHTLDDQKFLTYMAGAKAYATTAGFESVCEAMYLQKPVLMVPTHIEQDCNAIDAEMSGAGIKNDEFAIDKLLEFSPKYKPSNEFKYWILCAESVFLSELTEFDRSAVNVLFQF